jgi:hypothetical protein
MSNNIGFKCKFCKSINPLNIDKLAIYAGKPFYTKCNSCEKELTINVPLNITGNDKTTLPQTEFNKKQHEGIYLQPFLILKESQYHSEQSFALQIGSFTLGCIRNGHGDIVPDLGLKTTDPFISNKHCRITVSKANGIYKILLEDTSKNGTYFNCDVNGEKLEKDEAIYLQNDDFFTIGDNSQIKLIYS